MIYVSSDKKYIWKDKNRVFIKDNKIMVNKINGSYEVIDKLFIRCFILVVVFNKV